MRTLQRSFLFSFFSLLLLAGIVSFTSADKDELVKAVWKETNEFRKSKNLDKLDMRDDLNLVAQKHSEDMASGRRAFGHGGFDQRQVAVNKIIHYAAIAENVAYGATTAKEVVDMWKNSPGHRENMMGNYRYIGIGVARSQNGILYYTQIFVR
jgi:uncharacterized protein YkwD